MNVWWGVVTQIGFWGWLGTTVGFTLMVFPRRDMFRNDRALVWGGSFVLFFLIWVTGMLNA